MIERDDWDDEIYEGLGSWDLCGEVRSTSRPSSSRASSSLLQRSYQSSLRVVLL